MMRQQSQQNAQDNTPKKDLTKALIEKNPCGLCRAFELPKCNGHLVSGGSSSGGNEGEKSGSNNASHEENKLKSIFITDPANSPAHTFSNKDTKLEPVNYANATIELRPTYKTFNIEVINELLEKKILSIENKNDLGILIIQCNSALHDLLSDYEKDELNKFLDIVKEKFNDYKNRNNISPEDCSITFGKNNILCLTITIKNPELYDQFIHYLASNLISSPINEQSKELSEEKASENVRKSSLLNPFSIDNGPQI